MGQCRSTQRRQLVVRDDEEPLTRAVIDLATEYGRYGYRRITALLQAEGWAVNHKRVERIWRQECLKVPKRQPGAWPQLKAAGSAAEIKARREAALDVKRARDEEGAELTCPISFELFVDPVVAADGNTYERAAIEAWFERGNGRGRSPLTRELMKSQTLVPNRIVKKLADAFREQQQATRKRSRFDCDEPPPLNLLG